LLLAVLIPAVKTTPKPAATGHGVAMGEGGWVTEWASDATGSRRGRQITLYRPSLGLSDYRMEFIGEIQRNSLGWVFRAVDSKNYYVMKLEVIRPGALPTVGLTRFAVIKGIEKSHIQRMLPMVSRTGEPFRVRLDVTGSEFTVYVQGQVVDYWMDDKLKRGGIGFLNERDNVAQVRSIQIFFLDSGASHRK
jgi:hypothetical protein